MPHDPSYLLRVYSGIKKLRGSEEPEIKSKSGMVILQETKKERLVITKRGGEDGYKNFSIRVRNETVDALDEIARQTNRSRNDLINMMLEYGIANCDIE